MHPSCCCKSARLTEDRFDLGAYPRDKSIVCTKAIHFTPTIEEIGGLMNRTRVSTGAFLKPVERLDSQEEVFFVEVGEISLVERQREPCTTVHRCFQTTSSCIQPQVSPSLKSQIASGVMVDNSSKNEEKGDEGRRSSACVSTKERPGRPHSRSEHNFKK